VVNYGEWPFSGGVLYSFRITAHCSLSETRSAVARAGERSPRRTLKPLLSYASDRVAEIDCILALRRLAPHPLLLAIFLALP